MKNAMFRRHKLPFGAEVLDGEVLFRLRAPAAETVELCLYAGKTKTFLPMDLEPDGYFSLTTANAAAGSRYAYRIDNEHLVPDPASRLQPEGVHGPSQVVDPADWRWRDTDWRGRPWNETVIYELHVGAFTPAGTFGGVEERLEYLWNLGISAVELMPVAEFPGRRNWGYDGVLPFAPSSVYGGPAGLKSLIQAAHRLGLMVFLDVVYNHFGPEGNYLHHYAPDFFNDRHRTPWGAAINFDGPGSREVRRFFIENALYWLIEYHIDGLRLDAVHAIMDDSQPDILDELAASVNKALPAGRTVHLVLENDHNEGRYLLAGPREGRGGYRAQWNDDIHHAFHVLLTGEGSGYYRDYSDRPLRHLGRCLAEGFAYQGQKSNFRNGKARGEASGHLPPTAFVSFLQNHDQIGNRALGERLAVLTGSEALRTVVVIFLLAPEVPLLFMGQEWNSTRPFPFFCDFSDDLAPLVTAGRRREFASFPEFSEPAARERIPDPSRRETFNAAILDWSERDRPEYRSWLDLYRKLLRLRSVEIIPRLAGPFPNRAAVQYIDTTGLSVTWRLADDSCLTLLANPGGRPAAGFGAPTARLLMAEPAGVDTQLHQGRLPAWSAVWYLETGRVSSGSEG